MCNEVRQRNENNKETNLLKEKAIQESARPLVEATEKSAQLITSALKPVRKIETSSKIDSYERNKDKYFSIYRDGDSFVLGNKLLQIDAENNIKIDDELYPFSEGLWNLIMQNNPESFTEGDREKYKTIVEKTNLMNNPRSPTNGTKNTNKYKFLVELFRVEKEPEEENGLGEEEHEDEEMKEEPKNEQERALEEMRKRIQSEGTGLILPGNIKSLVDRFRLVCAERAAGNIEATTPEIVAILDEFLRRRHISKTEYNAMCTGLGC